VALGRVRTEEKGVGRGGTGGAKRPIGWGRGGEGVEWMGEMRAGWRVSGGWRRQALTAMLACAAGRTGAAHLRLFLRLRGGGRGAAGEGRRRGGKG
jgi:hypothetical protein